jgi:uncharacterized protein (DUF2147 family)
MDRKRDRTRRRDLDRPPASAAALGLAIACLLLASSSSAATPVGLWYAEGGSAQVAIEPCGETLCGRVVWLRSPLDEDGCELRDRHNPEPGLRDRPVVGLEVLRGLSPRSDGTWSDGRIYDPGSGSTYTCVARLENENRLRLRGYLGIPLIGRTTTWIRVGTEQQTCKEEHE